MNPKKCKEIFKRFQNEDPQPTTELHHRSHFELLIAVMLSAQATDAGVNKATAELFPKAHTPEAIFALGEPGLKKYIKTINYFKTKARNIIKTCELLIEKYHSTVPHTRPELESLPGVGRKTASVILNTAFKQAEIPVDTHIFRVSNRTHLATGKTPLEVEKKLLKVVPKMYRQNAHHWLILHGRYTCVARKPKCKQCIINDLCEYDKKNL